MAATVVDTETQQVNGGIAVGLLLLFAVFVITFAVVYKDQIRPAIITTIQENHHRILLPMPVPTPSPTPPPQLSPKLNIIRVPRLDRNLVPDVTKSAPPSSDQFGDPDSFKSI